MSVPEAVRDFFLLLFPKLGPTALVELRGFTPREVGPPKLRRWCPSVDEVFAVCKEYGDSLDLYFGVAARLQEGGKKEDLAYTTAFWADLDSTEAITRQARFPLPPSAQVQSGSVGHLHAYWLLREPWPLEAEEDRLRFERLNKGIAVHLGADHCWDASRVMRLPGSLNHKHTPPREVKLTL